MNPVNAIDRIKILALTFFVMILGGCSSFFYYPDQNIYVDVTRLRPPPKQVTFTDRKGHRLIGWRFNHRGSNPARAVLLFFHGNGQNLSSHFQSLYWILSESYDFFIFDYPGYGGSTGTPTPRNTVEAGIAAYELLRQSDPNTPVAFFGQSLGGAVALTTAARLGPGSLCYLIVESSFATYRGVARDVLSQSWWTWWLQPLTYLLIFDNQAPLAYLANLDFVPKLVIHGNQDDTVRLERGQQLFARLPEPKEFWLVSGGNHINTFSSEFVKDGFRQNLVNRLNQHCGGQAL